MHYVGNLKQVYTTMHGQKNIKFVGSVAFILRIGMVDGAVALQKQRYDLSKIQSVTRRKTVTLGMHRISINCDASLYNVQTIINT